MTSQAPGRGPHRTDLFSLVFGLIFLGGAGAWALQHYLDLHWRIDWELPHLGWIVAGGLILVGLLGVLSSLRGDRPTEPVASTESTESVVEEDRPPTTPAR